MYNSDNGGRDDTEQEEKMRAQTPIMEGWWRRMWNMNRMAVEVRKDGVKKG